MRELIDYRTISWQQTEDFGRQNVGVEGPGVVNFDRENPVPACKGTLAARFAVSYYGPDGFQGSLQLYLRDPADDDRRIMLVDVPDAALPTPLTWFRFDCCCQGMRVPYVKADGPWPHFELVLRTVTMSDPIERFVVVETWWEPLHIAQAWSTKRGLPGGA
jgi:hypothetical protein